MRIGRNAKSPVGRDVEREGAAAIERSDKHADGIGRRVPTSWVAAAKAAFSSGKTFATTGVMCSPWRFLFETTVVRIDAGHAAGRRAVKATRLARIPEFVSTALVLLGIPKYYPADRIPHPTPWGRRKMDHFVAELVFRAW